VLLDQTQRQCARENQCAGTCGLKAYFTGVELAPEAGGRRAKKKEARGRRE
jgi:hypothetical protein